MYAMVRAAYRLILLSSWRAPDRCAASSSLLHSHKEARHGQTTNGQPRPKCRGQEQWFGTKFDNLTKVGINTQGGHGTKQTKGRSFGRHFNESSGEAHNGMQGTHTNKAERKPGQGQATLGTPRFISRNTRGGRLLQTLSILDPTEGR